MLISIITPTFNAGSTLDETLGSVRQQLRHDTEHLLMDAGSIDRTLDVAKEYPYLIVRSESDRGIYDGMNKGAGLARGEWLLFLQGDDWLPEKTLEAYRRAIAENPDAEMICGNCEAVRESDGIWSPVWSVNDPDSKKMTVRNIALGEPMINARLFRREVFLQRGGFSLEYSLASDRDFLLSAAKAGVRQQEIQIPTYRYRWHSRSSTMTEGNSLSSKLRQENLLIAQRYQQLLSGSDKDAIRNWRAKIAVEHAMNAMENRDLKSFGEACRHGLKSHAYWGFSVCAEIACRLPGYLKRGCRTQTQARSSRKQ
jgi:glycosyltransferase involved in cell wall biosynthesis